MFSKKERQALKALAKEYWEEKEEEADFGMSDEKMIEAAQRIMAKGGPKSYAEAMVVHLCNEQKLM